MHVIIRITITIINLYCYYKQERPILTDIRRLQVLSSNRLRRLQVLSSSKRRIMASSSSSSSTTQSARNKTVQGNIELDSHADTIVAGANCILLNYTGRECDVAPYSEEYESITNVPIVTAATAWQSQETGQIYILVFNEALFYGSKLDHSLINPNQLRSYGVHFWDNPYDENHQLSIDTPCGLFMPLMSKGTKICFDSRVPTRYELENCTHIDMTS